MEKYYANEVEKNVFEVTDFAIEDIMTSILEETISTSIYESTKTTPTEIMEDLASQMGINPEELVLSLLNKEKENAEMKDLIKTNEITNVIDNRLYNTIANKRTMEEFLIDVDFLSFYSEDEPAYNWLCDFEGYEPSTTELISIYGTKEELEEVVVFYNVSKDGTLTYLSKKKKDKNKNDCFQLFYNVCRVEDMHVIIQTQGNGKTGKEWLLNTLPGDHVISAKGKALTNMRGSCIGVCDGCEGFCYAINGCRQHHNSVMPSVIKNLILYRMDPERFEREILQMLDSWKLKEGETDKVYRWHASGEVEDYDYYLMMMRIAELHPEVHFYSYTKKFGYVNKWLDDNGDFPSNFVWNLSAWEGNLEKSGFNMKYLSKVQVFEWKDKMSVEEYNKSIHCRSVIHNKEGEKKGHLNHEMNCKKCGLCWRGKCKGRVIYVYNH